VESFFKDKLAHYKIAMTYYLFSNAVSSYFWSNIATWWEGVMLIVHAHEEPPVAVPENVALDKLIVVTAVAHRSVDPLWHHSLVLPIGEQLQMQLKTQGSH
jgi:hypothetical protein